MQYIKNIAPKEVTELAGEVNVQEGQIVSKTLSQNNALSITLFAFSKNEEISTHNSKGDAFILVLDGTAQITVDDEIFECKKGESILMPANHPHSVFAKEDFKMILTVVFPNNN